MDIQGGLYTEKRVKYLSLGRNVARIEWGIPFDENNALFYCKASTPPVLSGIVNELVGKYKGDITIYVPTESVEAYKKADVWRNYAGRILPYNF